MFKKFLFWAVMIFAICGNASAQISTALDARVVVIILEDDGEEIIHNEMTTGILNAKLLEMGFKPVIDANHAIKLNDAQLLENVYKGYPEEFIRSLDTVTDYLVVGRFTQSENNLDFYDYYEGKMVESPVKSVRVSLKVNVIVYDTGEIISAFSTKGVGFGSSNSQASDNAIEIAANQAAGKLADAFKNFGKQTTLQLFFTVSADDYEKLDTIIEDLQSIDSVNFVKIREQRGKTMILSVEAYQPPSMIVKLLKNRTSLNFYVEKLSGNSCKLRISDEEDSQNEKISDDVDDADDSELDDERRH